MSYLIGTAIRFSTGTIENAAGTPTNPATGTLTIRKPDGTTVVVSLASWTNDAAGQFHYDYLPDLPGNYGYYGVTGNPNVAFQGTFDVQDSPVLTPPAGFSPDPLILDVDQVIRLLNLPAGKAPTVGTDAYNDVVAMVADMQGLLASWLGRPLSVQTGTETVYAGPDGKVRLTRTPMLAVSAVSAVDPRVDLSSLGVYGDTFDVGFGSSFDVFPTSGPASWALADAVTVDTLLTGIYAPGTGFSVTYTAGIDGANEPAIRNVLMLGCRRKLKQWLEDTEGLQGVRLGSGEGYQFDRIVSTQQPPQFAGWWTDDELQRVSRFRRRVIG